MCSAQVIQSDQSARLSPPPVWRVVKVEPLPDFCLQLAFQDGTQGQVDMSGLIHGTDAGVFTVLRDVERFQAARIEYGAVCWPGDLDLAPDALYADIKTHGRCELR